MRPMRKFNARGFEFLQSLRRGSDTSPGSGAMSPMQLFRQPRRFSLLHKLWCPHRSRLGSFAQLIEKLFHSFDKAHDDAVDTCWAGEAEARLDAYDAGHISAYSAEAVFERMNKR